MFNSPASNNCNINGSAPNDIDNQVPVDPQQTSYTVPDTNMEKASPWVPDQQDDVEIIYIRQLGEDTDPELVDKYLRRQVNRCTSLITLATIWDNLDEIHTLNQQRKDWLERLSIIESLIADQ